ncbi:DivIVA domain protein [Thermanaerovibrio velox DSM 12556]|uniref:DivIVA domain protein n=1 Tax=Thermanaerovibrio velox DSM 12556 TaxID=926567 RepID=H0UQ32_9BACT|nr:DivIVA domain-containing protein [Thermanaerovibrio velox]EHM09661.1 DivIVA domain protein [Thermanaerovibrio velox DSM 12556]
MGNLITPLDVVNQSFKRGLRGYDVEEVDDFLDQVAESLQAYIQRNNELERELENLKEQAEEFKSLKESLNETLLLAQKSAEERVKTANEQAEERVRAAMEQADAILREAKLKADRIVGDAEVEAAALRRELNRLTQMRCQCVAEFRAMLSKFDMMIREEAPVSGEPQAGTVQQGWQTQTIQQPDPVQQWEAQTVKGNDPTPQTPPQPQQPEQQIRIETPKHDVYDPPKALDPQELAQLVSRKSYSGSGKGGPNPISLSVEEPTLKITSDLG